MPLTSVSGTNGAWARGDGGCGPDETEAVWRWRWWKGTGELEEGTGDSGRGSMPKRSGLLWKDGVVFIVDAYISGSCIYVYGTLLAEAGLEFLGAIVNPMWSCRAFHRGLRCGREYLRSTPAGWE